MLVGAYFRETNAEPVVKALLDLPAPFRPSRYGAKEDGGGARELTDWSKYRAFLDKNAVGHFLFADAGVFDVGRATAATGTVTAFFDSRLEFDRGEAIGELPSTLVRGSAAFAFACASEEYASRNRIHHPALGSSGSAWVGRDLQRYVPGLYWRTEVACGEVARLGLELTADPTVAEVTRSESGVSVRMTYASADWSLHAHQVDEMCEHSVGVFSRRRLERELVASMSLVEVIQLLARWK